MKPKHLIFLLATLFVLHSCTKDEEVAITTVQINNLSIVPQYTRSAFACDLVANSPIVDVELQYSTDPLFGEGLYQTLQLSQNEHHYTANLEPLQQGQTYYVRYKVFNSFNSMIPAQVDTFRTRAYTLPSVRTDSVTHITTHSADCYFTLTDWGCDSLPTVGVSRRTSLSSSTDFLYTTTLSDSTFVCSFSDLTDGKTYSVYAFAKNAQGTAYSEKVIKFTTIAIVPPTITTSEVTAISYTSAVCGGDITSDGNAEVTERGICYATTAQPTTKDSIIVCGSGTGAFSTILPNLQDGTTYYVRAFATNEKGTAYGEQKTFATPAYSLPTLTTAEVTNISYTTATCGGNITSDGGQTITACGVCYSTKSNPTIADSKVASDNAVGTYTCTLSGLIVETTYYVRAYATNGKGTAYGEQKIFTTTAYSLPIISTSDVTNISYTSATCGGNITSDGGQTVISRGICYSTKSNPTIADSKVTVGNGIGSFTCNLTELSDGTIYYVRAYATNKKGTAYGEQKTFTTTAYSLPIISTADVTNISYTSATCGGNIISDGGQIITARGVCYSTKSNPTIADSKVTSGSGARIFTCNLTGLADGTTYYIRAYATNGKGTAYGAQREFSTSYIPYVSVSATKKVLFSNGNLQYRRSTYIWRFAENQYDYIGYDNSNIYMSSYTGWIDLFGWGTGKNPLIDSNNTYDYKTFVDWGSNRIGDDAPNTWRTLTGDEWAYIFYTRTNASQLWSRATVNGVCGLIVLPDNFDKSILQSWTAEAKKWDINTYSVEQWQILDKAGAIFLPAANFRSPLYMQSTVTGYYWTNSLPHSYSSQQPALITACLVFYEATFDPGSPKWLYLGCSVRLVKDL